MSDKYEPKAVTTDAVQEAIRALGEYKLHARLQKSDGDEAHRILPIIWPLIQEICLIADAAEAGMIKAKQETHFLSRILKFLGLKNSVKKSLTEPEMRKLFRAMDNPDVSTKKLAGSRRLGS